ncbi:hypothetical protein HYH03_015103 [Edaphochlamys debaryana]|uniref:Uncharacterized protein n=1 Tax=Edaphochlamys debaryana TaxID=47281 RepID=A0A836BSY0_9CHLO|nr:hypothetical protein HYH03_015103 [Edaphochlamys debaryana]|eukprot:KAG2486279.1 hypothetical protein HYH03_015103 [Edaphochlamys debaryana]
MAHEEHPYANYNKFDEAPTLVGNWVEERSLKECTGLTRNLAAAQNLRDSEVAALQEEGTLSSQTQRVQGDRQLVTHPRVMVAANNQSHPSDWRTSTQAAYRAPGEQRLAGQYMDTSKMGPRERMLAEQLMKEAREFPPELQATLNGPPIPITTESVYGGDLKAHDLTGVQVGARVMKDRDGRSPTRDPTFLAETGLMVKHQVDRLMPDAAEKSGAVGTAVLANRDVPVTVYSEAVAKNTYGGAVYGTTTLNSASPFGKSTNFSKPMNDYSKIVVDE